MYDAICIIMRKQKSNHRMNKTFNRWGTYLLAGSLLLTGGYYMQKILKSKHSAMSNTVPVKNSSLRKKDTTLRHILAKWKKAYALIDRDGLQLEEKYSLLLKNSQMYDDLLEIAKAARTFNFDKYKLLKQLSFLYIGDELSPHFMADYLAYSFLKGRTLDKERIIGAFAMLIVTNGYGPDMIYVDDPETRFVDAIEAHPFAGEPPKKVSDKPEVKKRIPFDGFKKKNKRYAIIADFFLDYLDHRFDTNPAEPLNNGTYEEYNYARAKKAISTMIDIIDRL